MMSIFSQEILNPILNAIQAFPDRNAFCIDETFFTYRQFAENISKIRTAVDKTHFSNTKVGLVVNDDIETYASIFALWLEGCAYVPLHPNWPIERCLDIVEQVSIDLILDSSRNASVYDNISRGVNILNTNELQTARINFLSYKSVSDNELAYILFTSGSTGKPKGVQLTRKNLSAFVGAFFDIYQVNQEDRCLQCFDLTFDLSIMSYLIPLLKGACVFTVPSDVIKYSYISGLIEDSRLTFALMAPSTIKLLRPYFDEIDGSSLKYSLFCGEALPLDVTEEWSKCASNAFIDNVYGPTEDTIFCSQYRFNRNGKDL